MEWKDLIDPYAGFTFHKKLGDEVKAGEAIVTAYTEREELLPGAVKRCGDAIDVAPEDGSFQLRPLIGHVMDKDGMHDYEEFLASN